MAALLTSCCIVPKCQCTIAMEELGDLNIIHHCPRHIASCREASDHLASSTSVLGQNLLQVLSVHSSVSHLSDADDL